MLTAIREKKRTERRNQGPSEGRASEFKQKFTREHSPQRRRKQSPSLIDIRRRIRSVKNTQQITKAMKMVSAAKLRRAQDRAIASRPYAKMLNHVLSNVAAAAAQMDIADLPLLAVREEKTCS